jgi:hypothetical protein
VIPSLGASGREMLSGVAMVEEIVRRETAVFGSLTEGKEVVDTPGDNFSPHLHDCLQNVRKTYFYFEFRIIIVWVLVH